MNNNLIEYKQKLWTIEDKKLQKVLMIDQLKKLSSHRSCLTIVWVLVPLRTKGSRKNSITTRSSCDKTPTKSMKTYTTLISSEDQTNFKPTFSTTSQHLASNPEPHSPSPVSCQTWQHSAYQTNSKPHNSTWPRK